MSLRSRRVAVLGTLSTLLAAAALLPSPAQAVHGPQELKLVNIGTGKCLDLPRASTRVGIRFQLYRCNRSGAQSLYYAEGQLRFSSPASPRCVDAAREGIAAGTPLIAYPCQERADHQRWDDRSGSDDLFTGRASGRCMRTTGAQDGAGIVLADCDPDDPAQAWRLKLPYDTDYLSPATVGTPTVANVTCTSATVSWSPAQDAASVRRYFVYADGDYVGESDAPATSTDVRLRAGATQIITVRAADGSSNQARATPDVRVTTPACGADQGPPTTPTGVKAGASDAAIPATFHWTASSDDKGVVAYDIVRDGKVIDRVSPQGESGLPTHYLDPDAGPRETHAYAVIARDAAGNTSLRSANVTVTTGVGCAEVVCERKRVGADQDVPWGLTALPDGQVLYTRRDAHEVVLLNPFSGKTTVVGTVPDAVSTPEGDGGLLGIERSPDFTASSAPWVYLYYSTARDNRVVRMRYVESRLDPSTRQGVLTGIPRGATHNGGRLRFGPDGKLYVTTGDAGQPAAAQDPQSLAGKVLRLNPSGSVPSDNPFRNPVWSLGHANPRGLAFDARGQLWEQELGEEVDETNLIVRGGNHGWPLCEGARSRSATGCATEAFRAPVRTTPAQRACGAIAVLRQRLFLGCERGDRRLWSSTIAGSGLGEPQSYDDYTAALFSLEPGVQDGRLWFTEHVNSFVPASNPPAKGYVSRRDLGAAGVAAGGAR